MFPRPLSAHIMKGLPPVLPSFLEAQKMENHPPKNLKSLKRGITTIALSPIKKKKYSKNKKKINKGKVKKMKKKKLKNDN
jgi:hypothetical protein